MSNNYSEENKVIEKAIEVFHQEGNDDSIRCMIEAFRTQMKQDGRIWVPVENVEEEGQPRPLRVLRRGEGDYCVGYTGEQEYLEGLETEVMSVSIKKYLLMILSMKDVEGLLVNPWGKTLHLAKTAIQILLEDADVGESRCFG